LGVGRFKAGLGYWPRAAWLGKGLALASAVVLLSMIWNQVDMYLVFAGRTGSDRQGLFGVFERPSLSHTLRALGSWDTLRRSPQMGLGHWPETMSLTWFMPKGGWGWGGRLPLRTSLLMFSHFAPMRLAGWLLAGFLVVLLLRATQAAPPGPRSVGALFVSRLPAWFTLWAIVMLLDWVMFYLQFAGRWEEAQWVPRTVHLALLIVLLLTPYTIMGLGMGWLKGLMAALGLLWRRPAEVIVLVLVGGLVLSATACLGYQGTFTVWMRARGETVGGMIGGTAVGLLLTAVAAFVTAWTMAAFLLFVLGRAGEPTEAVQTSR